jgi:arsenate reductase
MVVSPLHRPSHSPEEMVKESILFICTHNSARSQMAEGLMNHLKGDRYEAQSAGTVATRINPFAVRVMSEIGVDITGHRSKSIEEFRGRRFGYVVTVCDSARDSCPFFPGERTVHRSFQDPSRVEGSEEDKLRAFRRSRDEIRDWLLEYFGDERSDHDSG